MMYFLRGLSDFNLFIILVILLIVFSFISISIISRYVPSKLRYRENAVIGSISGLISIIYGVLVGLMALFLMNNISYTSNAVVQEGNALADLYRYSRWLDDPARSIIQNQLKAYIIETINVEWPLMKAGHDMDQKGHHIIHEITNQILKYKIENTNLNLILHDMLDSVKTLFDARQARIQMSLNELNTEIWLVVIIGTILMLIVTYFFGLNYYLHLLMSTAVSVMAASMIFLLLTLDKPFQGEFAIEPNFFKSLLVFMEEQQQFDQQHPSPKNQSITNGKIIVN